MSSKPRLLLIGYVWPEPRASAAGVRDLALIEIFRDAGYAVTFASTARPNEALRELEARGFAALPIAANDPAFDEQLAALAPDVVIFDRFVHEEQFGWRVRARCPDALRVLDTQDLHFLRKQRGDWLRAGAPLDELFARSPDLSGDGALRELAAVHRSDLTLLCSDFERELLVRDASVPATSLELAPFFYDDEPAVAAVREFGARDGFVAVGNFRHEPNVDAALWLKRELWPAIRAELPRAQLEIYGAYPPREVMALHAPAEGFAVRGPELGDIGPTLARFRVNLAPLRFGAGIKGKIAEGWRAGTPAVTTPIGAEGMCGGAGENGEKVETANAAADGRELPFGGLVGRGTAELAEQALRLHEREPEWRRASARGRALIRERFARARNGAVLLAAVKGARRELAARRARNLTGQLLWQQGLRATEYFSRWIEVKNQLKETETAARRP